MIERKVSVCNLDKYLSYKGNLNDYTRKWFEKRKIVTFNMEGCWRLARKVQSETRSQWDRKVPKLRNGYSDLSL